MSDKTFSGEEYDFAVGSIKGMRDWKVDDQGRLVGVTHPVIWGPGENASVCRQRTRCPKAFQSSVTYNIESCGDPSCCPPRDEATLGPRAYDDTCKVDGCADGWHPAAHTFDADCECGFWAYDEHNHQPHGSVTGIVEAYGKVTIGTLGFRAEKAKIVALSRQHEDEGLSLSLWLRLQQLYPDAAFYDDLDAMVTAHGAVLKTWDAPGEDFWDEEPPPLADSWATAYMRLLGSATGRTSLSSFLPPSSIHMPPGSVVTSIPRRSGRSAFLRRLGGGA